MKSHKRGIIYLVVIWSLLSLYGCTYHSIPRQAEWSAAKGVEHRHTVFLDQDGDIYPYDFVSTKSALAFPWTAYRVRYDFSKYDRAESSHRSTQSIIDDIRSMRAEKKEAVVVILVHGYNNRPDDVHKDYDRIREKVGKFNSKGQVFVEVYWDGMYSKPSWWPLSIWNNATGYSQMAGINGLRRVLLSIPEDVPIRIITHSRGASVALSAISDPPIDPDFLRDTQRVIATEDSSHNSQIGLRVLSPEIDIHKQNKREIRIALLAPAIGKIDFLSPTARAVIDSSPVAPREFPGLKTIVVGFNKNDPALRKILPKFMNFDSKFNATTFGTDTATFNAVKDGLEKEGIRVEKINYCEMNEHGSSFYVTHENLFDEEILPLLFN